MVILRKPINLGHVPTVLHAPGIPPQMSGLGSNGANVTSSVANSDGSITVNYDDGSATTTYTDGSAVSIAADGTVTTTPAPSGAGAVAPAPAAGATGSWLTDITGALTSVTGAIAQTVQSVVPAAASVIQQTQFNRVNAGRASKGLAPLTAAQYQSQYGIPTATVGVGLTPQTTKTAYIALGVIAAAVLGFAALRK